MQIASSANFTCSEFLSASLYTATVRMPSSLHALITRSAISPRFAINTFRNINADAFRRTLLTNRPEFDLEIALSRSDCEQRLPILHRLSTGGDTPDDLTSNVGLDLVHQLHRLDNAKNLSHFHLIAHLHKGRRARRWRLVEGPHDRRLHLMELLLRRSRS